MSLGTRLRQCPHLKNSEGNVLERPSQSLIKIKIWITAEMSSRWCMNILGNILGNWGNVWSYLLQFRKWSWLSECLNVRKQNTIWEILVLSLNRSHGHPSMTKHKCWYWSYPFSYNRAFIVLDWQLKESKFLSTVNSFLCFSLLLYQVCPEARVLSGPLEKHKQVWTKQSEIYCPNVGDCLTDNSEELLYVQNSFNLVTKSQGCNVD